MRRRPLIALLLAAGLLAALLDASASAKRPAHLLRPNPANARDLISKRMDPVRYDGGGRCVKRDPPGMKALIKWMKRNTRRNTVYGTIRCDGGLHATGRALDWMLDARRHHQKQLAMTVINTWMAADKRGRANALARRMGIQLIIYNCRFWQAGNRGWSRYSACSGGRQNADPTQGHIDHVHIELTKPAAHLRTSFWRSYGHGGSGHGSHGSGGGNSGGVGAAVAE